MARSFDTVGVVGLGTMGAGIAQVFARAGMSVVGLEPAQDALDRGRGHLERSTGRAVTRGRLSPDEQQAILDRVRLSTDMADLAGCDLVVEAVPERLDLKRELLGELDRICSPTTVLATNTSSLSVTELAAATGRPDRVIGLHFFNPAPVMRLVEVVHTVVTDPEVVADVEALVRRLGKVDVTVGDRAGFIANALLFGYLNHAASRYEAGFASREDIDAAMTAGCGLPVGPLALLDLIGIDTSYEILRSMYRQSRNRLHQPAPVLGQLAAAGLLGRKTGRGFYTYEAPSSAVVVADDRTPDVPSATDARGVRRVVVVGSGHSAAGLRPLLTEAGYDVTHLEVGGADGPTASQHEGGAGDGRLDPPDLTAVGEADLVVEAALDLEPGARRALLARLGTAAGPGAALLVATSDRPVVESAVATGRPADVLGLHVLDRSRRGGRESGSVLLEIVRTVLTSDETTRVARSALDATAATTVVCGDRAGLLVDALLFPYLNDAAQMLDSRYASADDIDTAMRLGCGYPMGPLETLDAIGLDEALATQQRLYLESREPGLAPAPVLQQLVTAGSVRVRTAGRR